MKPRFPSDREIAKRCAVSDEFARRVRKEISLPTVGSEPAVRTFDREIAKRCAVSDRLVREVRQVLTADSRSEPSVRTFVSKHGTTEDAICPSSQLARASGRRGCRPVLGRHVYLAQLARA